MARVPGPGSADGGLARFAEVAERALALADLIGPQDGDEDGPVIYPAGRGELSRMRLSDRAGHPHVRALPFHALVLAVNELRIWVAMRLAKDVETCCSLLRGEPVDPSCLDPKELTRMKALRLVRLDFAAIDLLEPQRREAA